MDEKEKYLKKLIIYGDLMNSASFSLLIPLVGLIIYGVISYIFSETTGEDYFTPLQYTILIMLPIIISGILGVYCAIQFVINGKKIEKLEDSNVNKDLSDINNNFDKAKNSVTFYRLNELLGIEKNDSLVGEILTITSISKALRKNKKILQKHSDKLYEKKSSLIYKIIIYLIPICCMLILCIGTLMEEVDGRNKLLENVDSINKTINSTFVNYELVENLNAYELNSYGHYINIKNNNKSITLDFDNKAKVEEILIKVSYPIDEQLNENEIINDLQTLKNSIDNLSNNYKTNQFKEMNVELNDECLDNIKNKICDNVLMVNSSEELTRRMFSIKNVDNEYYEITYSFYTYL